MGEAFPRLPAEQWPFAIGIQKRLGRGNHLQSHAFDSQEAQGRNQPRESRGVLRKELTYSRPKKRSGLSEIAFSQIAGEPQAVLLQQARKVVENSKKGFLSKSLLRKRPKPFRIKQGLGRNGLGKRNKKRRNEKGLCSSKRQLLNLRSRNLATRKGWLDPKSVNLLFTCCSSARKSFRAQFLEEVRLEIERTLASEYEAQSQRQWLGRLKKEAYVRITLPNTFHPPPSTTNKISRPMTKGSSCPHPCIN